MFSNIEIETNNNFNLTFIACIPILKRNLIIIPTYENFCRVFWVALEKIKNNFEFFFTLYVVFNNSWNYVLRTILKHISNRFIGFFFIIKRPHHKEFFFTWGLCACGNLCPLHLCPLYTKTTFKCVENRSPLHMW